MNIVLVGYRGSGKSTVGKILAQKFGWQFTDTDEFIVHQTGRSIKDIFAKEGDAGFRRMEHKVIDSLRKAKHRVISIGGGAILDAENRALIKKIGSVVWLRAPAAVLWSRISQDPHTAQFRPNLTEGGLPEVETVLKEREPIYQGCANQIVDTVAMSPNEVADSIEMWFRANDTEVA